MEMEWVIDSRDRLSCLHEHLLHRILSFLDISGAAQTSLLSRRWRDVWKCVPVLYVDADLFTGDPNPLALMDRVLSLRNDASVVDRLTYVDVGEERDSSLNCRIVRYAVSHHAQHIEHLAITQKVTFRVLFGSPVVNCDLKTLVLDTAIFDVQSSSRCLTLINCVIDPEEYLNCASSFPCLANLDISECFRSRLIRVRAPELLDFKLDDKSRLSIDIDAPQLKLFRLSVYFPTADIPLPTFSLVYVDRADISIDKNGSNPSQEMLVDCLNFLIPRLLNAKSVFLRCKTAQVLTMLCEYLERNQLAFTRLELLVCMSEDDPPVTYLPGEPSDQPNANRLQRQQN